MSSSSSVGALQKSGSFPGELSSLKTVPWKNCSVCAGQFVFKSPVLFTQHLRDFHCTKEGGSFVCRYGMNGVCPSLPVEGVSDVDYEDHVARNHVSTSHSSGVLCKEGRTNSLGLLSGAPTHQPNIVEDQYKWTIYNSEVNLPAALNDPRLTKRETDFFVKTWGESFQRNRLLPSPFLPDISSTHFEKYLQKNSSRLNKHIKLMTWVSTCQDQSGDAASLTNIFPSLAQAKLRDSMKTDLEQVPKMFLHNNFTLDNQEIFNSVFPWSRLESTALGSKGKSNHSSKLLQEKMSHYLDIIEQQIASQISSKSDAFFHAMTSHDELNSHMTQTLAAIKCLRDKIHKLDRVLVEGSLRVMKFARTRSNCIDLFNKLNLMSTVHQTQPTIQMLLSTCEFVGALDLISTTQEVLCQELSGVTCFRHLGSQLAELEKLIDKMMHAEFLRFITLDLNRDVSDTSNTLEEDRLTGIMFGLLRQHKFEFIDLYREEACTAIKAAMKQTVVMFISDSDLDNDGNASSLADQMRLLNFNEWMNLLQAVFTSLQIILKRTKNFHNILFRVMQVANNSVILSNIQSNAHDGVCGASDVVSERLPGDSVSHDDDVRNCAAAERLCQAETKGDEASVVPAEEEQRIPYVPLGADIDHMINVTEYIKIVNAARGMLNQICDHAHDRCVKLLLTRVKDGFLERLSSGEFVRLSREVEKFVSACEEICGRRSTSLRGSLQSQANRFVNRFHEERKTKLSLILDSERWKQADVPDEFQKIVHHIHSQRILTLPEKRFLEQEEIKPAEFLYVEGEKYAVVGTVLMLLKMIIEYCQCVEDISTVTPDILTRLIELLKMFNSRTCQLVLGAGALQLVGLKTITTKNLALASRCLQLIVYHLPLVKQHFESRLSSKQQSMLKHLDQISKDYNDHVREVFTQLLAIADSVLEAHLVNWEMKAPVPSSCFRSLSKQLGRLHEALCDIIPAAELHSLFSKVNDSFKRKLLHHLRRLNIPVDAGPQNGLLMAELAFYSENLKSLSGFKDFDPCFQEVWQNR